MTLNREDYPDLTDEQFNAINAEIDRARTQASETARKNAEKAAQRAQEAAIAEAIEREREKLEANDNERLEIQRRELAEREAQIAAQQRAFTAKTKLAEVLPADKIESLLPMFVGVDDKQLEGTLDTFIANLNETVKQKVDAEKQALLDAATPPASPTSTPVGTDAATAELLAKGETAAAADLLLQQAGYTTS